MSGKGEKGLIGGIANNSKTATEPRTGGVSTRRRGRGRISGGA